MENLWQVKVSDKVVRGMNILFGVTMLGSLAATAIAYKKRYEYQWLLALISGAVAAGYLGFVLYTMF